MVRDTVLPYAKRGFFAVRLDDAQVAVAGLPWIEQAEVRKQWPDVLVVRVVEHRPFAWWGEDRLLSERGRIFPSKGVAVPKGLRFCGVRRAVKSDVPTVSAMSAAFPFSERADISASCLLRALLFTIFWGRSA